MKIIILAGGTARSTAEGTLADDYLERFRATARKLGVSAVVLTEIPERKAKDPASWLSHLPTGAHVVVLDERGAGKSSSVFSRDLSKHIAAAETLAFAIGGADGLPKEVRARAGTLLSFGPQTVPHLLARVLLAEQLYRAATILTGHPYHRV